MAEGRRKFKRRPGSRNRKRSYSQAAPKRQYSRPAKSKEHYYNNLMTAAERNEALGIELDPKLFLIANEWLTNGFDMKAAMLKGGYSLKTAEKRPDTVFQRPDVVAYLGRRLRALEKKFEINAEWVTQQYARVAAANLGDLIVVDPMTGKADIDLRRMGDEHIAALSDFTTETYMEGRGKDAQPVKKTRVSFHSKLQALNALARMQGLYQDKMTVRHEHSVVDLLQAGRNRLRDGQRSKAIDADFEDITEDAAD